jgi:hypothetical protein
MEKYSSYLPSVAIMGMGFAGTWQEIYLLDNAKEDMVIYEIEAKEHRRGGGIAYGECDTEHQVNLPPERQFGPHNDNKDYINWLNTADRSQWPQPFRDRIGDQVIKAGSGEFPRELFKLYSNDRLDEAKARAFARGLNIHTVKVSGQAVAVDESGERAVVKMADGSTVETDVWVAATGHGPAITPPFMNDVQSSERVLTDPWDKATAARMNARAKDESILYVGTGMTTYDLMIRDEKQGHTGKQVMMSRHADVHHTYDHGYVFKPGEVEMPEAFDKATNMDELLNGKKGEYAGAMEIYERMVAPVDKGGKGLHPEQVLFAWEKQIPKLLKNLPEADAKALFRAKTQANTRRIGIAPKVGEAIERAKTRGMETWSGDIHKMLEKPDGIYVDMTRTDIEPPQTQTVRFDRVYSGLGMSNDFGSIQKTDPLWKNIIEENKFTEPHRFGGVVADKGKLPGARAGFAVGMPVSGTRVEKGFAPTISGAVVSIRTDMPDSTARIFDTLQAVRKDTAVEQKFTTALTNYDPDASNLEKYGLRPKDEKIKRG